MVNGERSMVNGEGSSIQHQGSNVNGEGSSIQHPASSIQHPAPNPQPPTSNLQHHTSNIIPPTSLPVPWCPHAYYLEQRPSFTLDPSFHAGAYYVQEASSMFLWEALRQTVGEAPSQTVLDLCAAPGGKSTLLSTYFQEGLVVSNEVIKSRANILVENISKWGNDNVVVTNNDPQHFQQLPGFFDVLVVDAPCSGSGLFRKDPHAIDEWSEGNVQLCSQRQQRILGDVLPALKEGGVLIYSTCSYSPAEDEDIADWLVGEMHMESLPLQLQEDWNIVETISAQHKAHGYRFYPDKVKGEGLFIAAFRKTAPVEEKKLKELSLPWPSKREAEVLQTFMEWPLGYFLFKQGDCIRAMPQQWEQALKNLSAHLYIKKAGIGLGAVKGKDFVPEHELAVSALSLTQMQSVELSREQALQYLRRKELVVEAPKGWTLVKYDGWVLGWIKALPNRINNYYPQEWRILKA